MQHEALQSWRLCLSTAAAGEQHSSWMTGVEVAVGVQGLAAAPGTPKLPPATPVIFDVELVYCPGEGRTGSWLCCTQPAAC